MLTTSYTNYLGFAHAYPGMAYAKKSEDGKTISWYNTKTASEQFNEVHASMGLGTTYHYIAIG